jgi:hypothetical protein
MRISHQRILRAFGFRPLSPYASVDQPLARWIACLAWRHRDALVLTVAIVATALAYYVVD